MARDIGIIVTELDRDRCTRVATVEIGDKKLAIPSFCTLIQSSYDLDLLVDLKREYRTSRLGAFVTRYFDAPETLKRVQPGVKRDVLGRIREDKYSLFFRNNLFLIDPSTEYLYYEANRNKFFLNPETPREIIDFCYLLEREKKYEIKGSSFNKRKARLHKEFWSKIVEDTRKKIKFITRVLEYQMACGVDVVVPPAPLIDSKKMLEIAIEVNNVAKELARGRRHCANYLPIRSTLLKKPALIDDIKMAIMENSPRRLTILKFKYLNLTRPESIMERNSYRELMLDLDYLGQTSPDRACMILENSYQSFASAFAGFDLVSSSFTMYDGDVSFSEHPPYGKYLDPVWKVHRTFDEMVEVYNNLGKLPCPCEACKEIEIGNLRRLSPEEWYILRRIHVPLYMDKWMGYVAKAVADKNTELAIDAFANSKISILKDLLP